MPACCVRFTHETLLFRLHEQPPGEPVEAQQPADPNRLLDEEGAPLDPDGALVEGAQFYYQHEDQPARYGDEELVAALVNE